jgi:hypothetical protein
VFETYCLKGGHQVDHAGLRVNAAEQSINVMDKVLHLVSLSDWVVDGFGGSLSLARTCMFRGIYSISFENDGDQFKAMKVNMKVCSLPHITAMFL